MYKRFIMIGIFLFSISLGGVAGYMMIEGWSFLDSLYMVVITLASVGFMEIHELSPQGRVFTVVLIIFGMGVLLSGVTTFTAFLVGGELSEILRRKKMNKQISSLQGHYIVCGMGPVGRHIIEELHKTGRNFVAIDVDENVCRELEEKGFLYIKGDATSVGILKSANSERAVGLFCALDSDAENLLLIMTARVINRNMRIIAKAEKNESEEKMFMAGADGVVLPQFIGGLRMASEMVRPEAVTFLDKMLKGKGEAVRVEDVRVSDGSKLMGMRLKDCDFLNTEGLLLVAIKKGEKYIINPGREERIEDGDIMVFISEERNLRMIREFAGQV